MHKFSGNSVYNNKKNLGIPLWSHKCRYNKLVLDNLTITYTDNWCKGGKAEILFKKTGNKGMSTVFNCE